MKLILLRNSAQLQRRLFLKNKKYNHSSASDWWEYFKYLFKEYAKILSKNSTTQENITISRENLFFLIKNTKKQSLQQVSDGKTPNLVLKRMLELFLKVLPLKKILEF